ncbi:MAG: DOMON-like domain-containing protein [Rhodocyclaceae bacterium]|nr:DOMON-like domain-containing protein [Rhodocyclaceae bacterium]
MTPDAPLLLVAHPGNPPIAVERITVAVSAPGGAVRLHYRIRCGDDALHVPGRAAAGFADGLWRHTCFEAFFAPVGASAYREFNFSADGRWAGYCFANWRQRSGDLRGFPAPRLSVGWLDRALEVDVVLPAALLGDAERFDVGLSAVVEGRDRALGYWALSHAPGPPDFHRRAGFCYRLGRDPGGEAR